jgi:FkbM family methyltransferase
VNERLLVSPVSVGRPTQPKRFRDRKVPAVLRSAVAISRAIFRGRGVGFACRAVARALGSGGSLSFQLGGGGWFLVRVDDLYWLQLLLLDRSYELGLDRFLQRTLTSADGFLDCGANLGLWSIAAARVIRDPDRVVAVEAGSHTFARLIANWEANDRSFTVLHRAVSDVTDKDVSFFASDGDHASATLLEGLSPDDAQLETVITVSLLDLVRERIPIDASEALLFVKLDIEGMERQVLATIDPEQHGELVILYEEHGSETTHTTAFLLERGFRIAFMADDGSLERIRPDTLHRVNALKVNPAIGYNLLAVAARGAAMSRLAGLYPQLADSDEVTRAF